VRGKRGAGARGERPRPCRWRPAVGEVEGFNGGRRENRL